MGCCNAHGNLFHINRSIEKNLVGGNSKKDILQGLGGFELNYLLTRRQQSICIGKPGTLRNKQ
jgi:hypothetical protein